MFFLEKAYFYRKSRSSGAPATNRIVPLPPLDSPDFSDAPSIFICNIWGRGTQEPPMFFCPSRQNPNFNNIPFRVIIAGDPKKSRTRY